MQHCESVASGKAADSIDRILAKVLFRHRSHTLYHNNDFMYVVLSVIAAYINLDLCDDHKNVEQ